VVLGKILLAKPLRSSDSYNGAEMATVGLLDIAKVQTIADDFEVVESL
jgi:hypothetical protein